MSITYDEVASSGISEADFDKIAASSDGFLKHVEIQRHNPDFEFHDQNAQNPVDPFSADASPTMVLCVCNANGTITGKYLLLESDDPITVNTWQDAGINVSGLGGLIPKVVYQSGAWDVVYVNTAGAIKKLHSATGQGSWSSSTFSTFNLPIDGSVVYFSYANGGVETCYFWQVQQNFGMDMNIYDNYTLKYVDATLDYYTNIYWHAIPTGFDAVSFTDTSDDTDGLVPDSGVRHLLVMALPGPNIFTFQDTPSLGLTKQKQETGGLYAVVVRPKLVGNRLANLSKFHEIQTFDRVTALQYRKTCHVSVINGTIILGAIGGDGDYNGSDQSFGYSSLYYYSTKNGFHWSQDRIVPVPDDSSFSNFQSGAGLVRCGNYIYLLSADTALRSLACTEFGAAHPDWTVDLTRHILSYSSESSDVRQSSITLDNRDGYFNTSTLLSGAEFTLLTKIGKHLSGVDYLFLTTSEEIDSITPSRERPLEELQLTSRDRMSWLMDRTESAYAIQYDNQIAGLDTYGNIGTTENSGLAHTAVVAGTFGTTSNQLRLKSSYKEGIALKTYKVNVEDGMIEGTFVLMKPGVHDSITPNGFDNPTYAGVIFRVTDKNNFIGVRYDYYAQLFVVFYRKDGIDVGWQDWSASAWFISQANNELPFTIRVEFRTNYITIYALNSSGDLDLVGITELPGDQVTYSTLCSGYTGLIMSSYSDEDTNDIDDPTIDPTPPPNLPPSTTIPTRIRICVGGHLLRATSITDGTPNFEDVTPTTFVNQIKKAIANPWEQEGCLAVGTSGVAYTSDFWNGTPVWTDYTGLVPGNIWDIQGSINRRNYWVILASYNHDGNSDRISAWYTSDFFTTMQGGPAVNDLGVSSTVTWGCFRFGLVMSCHNSGDMWAFAGPNNSWPGAGNDQYVAHSSDWGHTWTKVKQVNDAPVGLINIPYSYPGGAPAVGAKPFMLLGPFDVSDGTDVQFYNTSWSRHAVTNMTGEIQRYQNAPFFTFPPRYGGNFSFNSLTVDSAYLNFCTDTPNRLFTSNNGGVSWTANILPNYSRGEYPWGINGYPVNPNWLLLFGVKTLQVTLDRGASWIDLWPGFETWQIAEHGSVIWGSIDYAEADLSEFIDFPFI